MSLADLLRDLALYARHPEAAEAAREAAATTERAGLLQSQRSITREDALRIAVFSRGTWAQRYPARRRDLGEDATLFVADWLSARALGAETEHMHEALDRWRDTMTAAALDQRFHEIVDIAKEKLADLVRPASLQKANATPRAPNRFERRRARSRRWRG